MFFISCLTSARNARPAANHFVTFALSGLSWCTETRLLSTSTCVGRLEGDQAKPRAQGRRKGVDWKWGVTKREGRGRKRRLRTADESKEFLLREPSRSCSLSIGADRKRAPAMQARRGRSPRPKSEGQMQKELRTRAELPPTRRWHRATHKKAGGSSASATNVDIVYGPGREGNSGVVERPEG